MKIHPLGKLTDDEKKLVQVAVPELATNIQTVRSPSRALDCANRLNDLLMSQLPRALHSSSMQRNRRTLAPTRTRSRRVLNSKSRSLSYFH